MTLETLNFKDAVAEFSAFLAENGLTQPLLWAFQEDVVSEKTNTFKTLFWVRLPLPGDSEQRAERHFELGKSKGLGMALAAYAVCDDGLLCSFVVPADSVDSEYLMIRPDQIKYSFVKVMPSAAVVRNSFRWTLFTVDPRYKKGNHFVYLESKRNL
jgi:hypothetical protein